MISWLGQRHATVTSFLVLLPLTLIMFAGYWSLFLPINSLTRLTYPAMGLIVVASFSVTASNLNPPTSVVTRLVLLIILSFVYLSSLVLPQCVVYNLGRACIDMEKGQEKAEKKNEKEEKDRATADKEYKEACKAAKEAGDAKPAPPPALSAPPKDNTAFLSDTWIWFFVVTPGNVDKIKARVIFFNDFCRLLYIFIFFAFIAPVFLLPSSYPDQTKVGYALVEGDAVGSLRYLIGETTIAIYAGILGFSLLATLVMWGVFKDKEEDIVNSAVNAQKQL